jgi:hypothetical protein
VQTRWLSALFGIAALALFLGVMARTVQQLARDPELNWDMLPAMALALEWEEKDPVELHRQTYALAQTELAPEAYARLTAPGVRAVRAQDPAAFHEHLAFYRARVLYSIAVRLLHRQGMALSAATWWIPLGCYVLVSLLALAWAASHLSLGPAALFSLGLAHTPALLNQASTSSADGMAALFVALGAWALIERNLFFVAAPLFTLAIGARPDTVILIGFLAAALFFVLPQEERPSWIAMAAWVVASGAFVYWLSQFAGEYGWWPLMQISFVEKAVHPAELPTSPDWNEYFAILRHQVEGLPGDGYVKTPAGEVTGSTGVLAYGALGLVALGMAWRVEPRVFALVLALLLTFTTRFFLFPQIWDRFFAPLYTLVPLALVSLVVPRAPAPAPRPRTLRRPVSSSSSVQRPY